MFEPRLNKDNWLSRSASACINIEVRPYTVKELCALYRMSYRSFSTCLGPIKNMIGERPGRYYTVRQVEIIFMELGIPYSINESG
jgi:hypothetical protein